MELDLTGRLFDLISENENIDDLLNELTGGINLNQLDALSNPTFVGLQSLVEDHSKLTGSSISIVSANILCSVIQSSFAGYEQKLYLDTAEERAKLDILINVGKHFISRNQFSSRVFAKNLNKKNKTFVPFEVVWMLHRSSLMTLDLFFLCNLDHPNVINDLSSHLGSICCKDDGHDIDLRKSILYDVLVCLLTTAFSDNVADVITQGLKKVAQALLDNILKKLLSLKEREHDINMFELLNSKYGMEDGIEVMEKYYMRQVVIILTKKADEGFSLDLFSNHQKWTFANMNKNMKCIFEELLVPLSTDEILSALTKLLEQKEFDWRMGLMFLSIMLVCFPSFINNLEGLVMDMLQRSLQTQNFEELAMSLLLMRHCCMQGGHIFMSYSAWFKKSFKEEGVGSVQLNKKSHSTLVKVLTSLVPHEEESFIRVHIQNPPPASQKFRDEWFSYVTLAKTHISDIRSDVGSVVMELEHQEMLNRVEKEIVLAVESFQKDNKVPSSIIEMSLFAKPHFIGKFLPVLLEPRLLPDIPDERMLLITALHESHKIPSTMFRKYESECRQMTLDLLRGVIDLDDDDEDMQILQLPLLDQLKASLKCLKGSLLSQNNRSNDFMKYLNDTSDKILTISRRISSDVNLNVVDATSIFDLADRPIGGGELYQASHVILEFILKMTFLAIQQAELAISDWLDKLILMLGSHRDVLTNVYRIATIFIKSDRLSPCHFSGLANIVSQRIHADKEMYGTVTSNGRSFVDVIADVVKFGDVDHLRRMVLFVCSYVVLVRNKFGRLRTPNEDSDETHNVGDDGIVPQEFVDVLLFALPKLHPQLRSDDDEVKMFIENSKEDCLKPVMRMIYIEKVEPFDRLLMFRKWVNYETNCFDADENFSVVLDYSMWVVKSGRYTLDERHEDGRSRLERFCVEIFEHLCRCNLMTSGGCFDCKKDSRRGGEGKYLCFVYLLQTISNQLSIDHACSPWLWEGIDRAINNPDTNPSSRLLVNKKILTLVKMLPPSLLISNGSIISDTPVETITSGLNNLISFVNNSLRNITSDHFLTIDFNMTLHIVQSLSNINSLNLMDLFNRSPLFTFSVFHHWEGILLSDAYKKENCSLKIIFDRIDRTMNDHGSIRTANLLSLAASFVGLEQNYIQLFQVCLEMASCIYFAVHGDRTKSSFALVSSKLETRPDFFVKIFKSIDFGHINDLLRSTLPDFVHSLWSSGLLSTFVHLSKIQDFCVSSSREANFINSLLECYKNFNEFFESGDIDRSALYSDPFASLGEASQAIISYLRDVPSSCFRDVDEEILNNSDVLIRSLVNKH